MALSDIKIKALKPDGTATSKSYKATDEKGLYLEVKPTGSKLWRFKYRFAGKEKLLSMGIYPDVSLKKKPESREVNLESRLPMVSILLIFEKL